MGQVSIPLPESGMSTEELANLLAQVIKELQWAINGNLDANNIRANSVTANEIKAGSITADKIQAGAVTDVNIADAAIIASKIAASAVIASKIAAGAVTADKISVSQLSAIAADLGTVIAGQIFGTYIATANGTYPRSEMSNTTNLFSSYSDLTHYLSMMPATGSGPGMRWVDGANTGYMAYIANFGLIMQALGSNQNISLNPQGQLALNPGGSLSINGINGFNGEFLAGSLRVVVTKGIITSVT